MHPSAVSPEPTNQNSGGLQIEAHICMASDESGFEAKILGQTARDHPAVQNPNQHGSHHPDQDRSHVPSASDLKSKPNFIPYPYHIQIHPYRSVRVQVFAKLLQSNPHKYKLRDAFCVGWLPWLVGVSISSLSNELLQSLRTTSQQ